MKQNSKKRPKKPHRIVVLHDNALHVFTDGSCLPNPRRGGIGIRFVITDTDGNEVTEDHAPMGYEGATNQQMELMACIKGLEMASDHAWLDITNEIWVITDSKYVIDNIQNTKFVWPKQKWTSSKSGRPIENVEQWKNLVKAETKIGRRVKYEWVKGHSKNAHNKIADKLATQSAEGVLSRPLRVSTVRRKKTAKSVQVGSVVMEGQVFAVRIIRDEYLLEHKLYKFMYEVLTETSPYFGNSDYIYSEILLRAGHHYEVRVNSATMNPRIVEVVNELDRKSGEVIPSE